MRARRCLFGKTAMIGAALAASWAQGCVEGAREAEGRAVSGRLPLTLVCSADMGVLPSDSGAVSRVVGIRNVSATTVHISRWSVSCDCLSVAPAAVDIAPETIAFICLVFDPGKDVNGFVGNLAMRVDGINASGTVCTFAVPAVVVRREDLVHLGGTQP